MEDPSHCLMQTLTETISVLEMVGAMLLMKREQVLWSGRGLGASSLGFFFSSLSSFTSRSSSSSGFFSSTFTSFASSGRRN